VVSREENPRARLRGNRHEAARRGLSGCLAAAAAPGISLFTLEDLNFIFLNNFIVLSVVFLFFAGTWLYFSLARKTGPPGRVKFTLKLAVFGFLLLFLDGHLQDVPHYGFLLSAIQGLVVLFCLANLVIYLLVDIYLYHRSRREAPSLVREILSVAVYLFFAIVSLRVIFSIEISSIVTTTTVLTAAVAFAMQSTLGNILAGFSIQIDRLLRLRTWVSIHDKNIFGQVLNVGFRYTTLRSLENNLVLVPNSTFTQNIVTSFGNREDENKVAVNLTVSLGYDLPPERAKEILLGVLTGEKSILAEPAALVRLRTFAESSIDYQLKFFLEDYSERDAVSDRVFSRTWYAVTREGFSFPFPHRQVIETQSAPPFVFPVETVAQGIGKVELFSMLDESEVLLLAEKARVRVFGPGEIVVKQNDGGDSLFLVMKGRLQALVNEIRVGELAEGNVFGEMSLLTGEPRKATVAAESQVILVELSREIIEPLIRRKPEIMEALGAILAHREIANEQSLREADRAMEEVRKCAEYVQRLKRFFGL
jgi:small-conductance mechanosensitive channel/CRP-like cAMP-binding protein